MMNIVLVDFKSISHSDPCQMKMLHVWGKAMSKVVHLGDEIKSASLYNAGWVGGCVVQLENIYIFLFFFSLFS